MKRMRSVTGNPEPQVLVIDEDPAVANTLADVLNLSGFEATAGYTGAYAVELAGMRHFDLLVTAVVMADMNGVEAALEVQKLMPDCRVLLISGHPDALAILDAAKRRGHHFDVLAKPIPPVVILETLRNILHAPQNA